MEALIIGASGPSAGERPPLNAAVCELEAGAGVMLDMAVARRRRTPDHCWMPKKTDDAQVLIARVRKIALALPGATEKLSHGEPAFFVRGRMFFAIDNDHHGSGHVAVWCNAPPGAQESLVAADPRHFFVPPYVGKGGWLGIRLDSGLPFATIGDLLRQAHEITGVKRRRHAL